MWSISIVAWISRPAMSGVAAVGCADQPGAIEGVLGIHVGAVFQSEV
jgi:hypothetical protein